jgi:hypothetical protein
MIFFMSDRHPLFLGFPILSRKGLTMNTPIKILYIDPDFRITYFIKHPGSMIRSLVPLQEALQLLKTQDFDLILSEPHGKAILGPQTFSKGVI